MRGSRRVEFCSIGVAESRLELAGSGRQLGIAANLFGGLNRAVSRPGKARSDKEGELLGAGGTESERELRWCPRLPWVFVLKRSMASGFSGVDNPLFFGENTRMLFGDAKESVSGLIAEFKG